jgi:hypothetical protein
LTSRIFTTDDASMFLSGLSGSDVREDLQSDAYGESYRALIKLAATSSDDPQHDAARALACAAYGWMPTILKDSKFENIGSVSPLKKIKSIKSWEEAEIFLSEIDDVAPINGSWVGTSKFLHFLNPEIFPIWDSRVAVSFHSKISIEAKIASGLGEKLRPLQLNHFCNRKDHYFKYSEFMINFSKRSDDWIDAAQKEIKMKYGHVPTKLRCLELALFNRHSINATPETDDTFNHQN